MTRIGLSWPSEDVDAQRGVVRLFDMTATPAPALTNEEMLDMLTGDGLPPRIAAEKIRKARNCAFDSSREALKKLKASGVPDSVIVAMGGRALTQAVL